MNNKEFMRYLMIFFAGFIVGVLVWYLVYLQIFI
jgi:hypothetical protein